MTPSPHEVEPPANPGWFKHPHPACRPRRHSTAQVSHTPEWTRSDGTYPDRCVAGERALHVGYVSQVYGRGHRVLVDLGEQLHGYSRQDVGIWPHDPLSIKKA